MTIKEFSKHLKIPVNRALWNLWNNVPQVPKCSSTLSTRVPKCLSSVWVPQWTAFDNWTLIPAKIVPNWLHLFFLSYIKLWLSHTFNSEDYSAKNFECSEINGVVLPNKKWATFDPNLYIVYKCSDHIKNIHQFWAHCFIW